MPTPFLGMDPYLEHPGLWEDVHTRLIVAIADALGPQVRPEYRVAVERRIYTGGADLRRLRPCRKARCVDRGSTKQRIAYVGYQGHFRRRDAAGG